MFKKDMPGIILCVVTGIVAYFLSTIIPNVGDTSLAIILGVIIGNTMKNTSSVMPGAIFSEKKILPCGIMLMGITLNAKDIIGLGFSGILYIVILMTLVILVSVFISKKLGFSEEFGLTIGAGNAVCGSSAVGAAGPVVHAKEDEIGLSVAIVNLMGTVLMFLLPVLCINVLNLGSVNDGALIGGTLQSVGQAVASGGMVSDDVKKYATLFKMIRVTLLGVVVLSYSIYLKSKDKKEHHSKSTSVKVPPFIFVFFGLAIINTLQLAPTPIVNLLDTTSDWLMIFAMVGIGMRIKFSDLLKEGPKALLIGTLIVICQVTFALGLIKIIL